MPVQSCTMNGKPGYQFGDSGRCYTYSRGNDTSRKRAKRKAHLQGAAVEANRGSKSAKEMGDPFFEFDDSINDYVDMVRREFNRQFPYNYSDDNAVFTDVTDVFDDYVVCRQGDKYYEVGFTEDEESIVFDDKDKWTTVKLSYVQEMLKGHFTDTILISEFKGSYPEIKVFDDIDLKELTAGDQNPVFATLPIGMANVTSGNRRYYNDKFIVEMEKQVRDRKPIGIMGHLSKEERSTAFPAEAVHWVGAQRVSELLWGKGYFPPGEPRSRLQRYKATKKRIATSIDADADGVWDSNKEAYIMIAETLNLKQIDLAPEDRAGIPGLSAVPLITQEMADNARKFYMNGNGIGSIKFNSTEDEMGKEDVIKELTREDAAALPESVRSAIISGQMSEFRKELGLPDDADIMAVIRGLKKAKEETNEKTVSNRITELVSDPEKGIKVESVRGIVMELIEVRKPKTVQEVETAYEEVSKSPRVLELLKTVVQETMGPAQQVPLAGQATRKGKYINIPELPKS